MLAHGLSSARPSAKIPCSIAARLPQPLPKRADPRADEPSRSCPARPSAPSDPRPPRRSGNPPSGHCGTLKITLLAAAGGHWGYCDPPLSNCQDLWMKIIRGVVGGLIRGGGRLNRGV